MAAAAQPPQQEHGHAAHHDRTDHALVHDQRQIHVVNGVVHIAVGIHAAQPAEGGRHIPVVPGRDAVLLGVGVGRGPKHMMPHLEPAGQKRVDPGQQRRALGHIGVEQIAGEQAGGGQQRVERDHERQPRFACEHRGQQALRSEQRQQQKHGKPRPAAARPQQRIRAQRGQPGPVKPAQPVPAQPGPGHKNAQKPRAVPVIVPVAVIPVAGVPVERHQPGEPMQQLHGGHADSCRDQVDLQRGAQVDALRGGAQQHNEEKPHILAVGGGKAAVTQRNGQDRILRAVVIARQKNTFEQQQRRRAAGQQHAAQVAESRQRRLNIGTENLRKDQQHRQRGTEQPLAQPRIPPGGKQRGTRHRDPPFLRVGPAAAEPVHPMQAHRPAYRTNLSKTKNKSKGFCIL